jgi:4-oxalocrotonate tautomerase
MPPSQSPPCEALADASRHAAGPEAPAAVKVPGRPIATHTTNWNTPAVGRNAGRKQKKTGGELMPFVSIRILEGHPQERKDEITRRVASAISEVAQVPKEAVWVVFEDIKPTDWFVGDRSVARIKSGGGS